MLKSNIKKLVSILADKTGYISYLINKPSIIVLMLHKVNDDNDVLPITIKPSLLKSIIKEIKNYGEIISLDDVITNNKSVEDVKFAITFDDGYLDNYENAFPILNDENAKATIYLSVDHINGERHFWFEELDSAVSLATIDSIDLTEEGIGKYNLHQDHEKRKLILEANMWLKKFSTSVREQKLRRLIDMLKPVGDLRISKMLSWNHIEEMHDKCITFGSHTMTHAILANETQTSITRELVHSKLIIEDRLNCVVDGFAYPNGRIEDIGPIAIEEVKKAGYKYACSTINGLNKYPYDTFLLRRVNIHNNMCTYNNGKFSPVNFWTRVLGIV